MKGNCLQMPGDGYKLQADTAIAGKQICGFVPKCEATTPAAATWSSQQLQGKCAGAAALS